MRLFAVSLTVFEFCAYRGRFHALRGFTLVSSPFLLEVAVQQQASGYSLTKASYLQV